MSLSVRDSYPPVPEDEYIQDYVRPQPTHRRKNGAGAPRRPQRLSVNVSPPSTIHEDDVYPGPVSPAGAYTTHRGSMGGISPYGHYDDVDFYGQGQQQEHEHEATTTAREAQPRRSTSTEHKSVFEEDEEENLTPSSWTGDRAGWLPEILCCVASIVSLIVLCLVLKYFDGEPIPNRDGGGTVNVLVAFFATMARAAFVMPVLEGLAQMKWNWFSKTERPIKHFQAYDKASRGPWGSIKLLIATKGEPLAIIGAFILITSLITSTLSQGAVGYTTRLVVSDIGLANITRSDKFTMNTASLPADDIPILYKRAVQNGIYTPAREGVKVARPQCSTSDCAWFPFNTLDVCVSTRDVTDKLAVSSQFTPLDTPGINLGILPSDAALRNASLPNGAYLIGGPGSYNLNLTTLVAADRTVAFADSPDVTAAALANLFAVYTTQTANGTAGPNNNAAAATTFRAVEMVLHFCVGTYATDVTDGVANATQTRSTFGVRSKDTGSGGQWVLNAPPEPDKTYTVDADSARKLAAYLTTQLAGTYSAALGRAAAGRSGAGDALGAAMFLDTPVGPAEAADVDGRMRQAVFNVSMNVATSLANTIRSASGQAQPGTVYVWQTYVMARWGWLAMLIIQVIFSSFFLFGIIMQTKVMKVKILKSSTMAAMFAIPAEDRASLERQGLGHIDEDHIMNQAMAKKTGRVTGIFAVQKNRGWVLDLNRRAAPVPPR